MNILELSAWTATIICLFNGFLFLFLFRRINKVDKRSEETGLKKFSFIEMLILGIALNQLWVGFMRAAASGMQIERDKNLALMLFFPAYLLITALGIYLWKKFHLK